MKLKKILIANRGEIACRLIKTCKNFGLETVAIYSDQDETTMHVLLADKAVNIGGAKNYQDIDAIVNAATEAEVDAVIPGYGFLSENAEFAMAVADKGIVFVGPTVENLLHFSLKHKARELAAKVGIPLLPGSPLLKNVDDALSHASSIGYPVIIKTTAGGGGIGMNRCDCESELLGAFGQAASLAKQNFGNAELYIEKYVASARHIEIQVFGDKKGHVAILGERDCTIQRRYQKIIEESPSPFLTPTMRKEMCDVSRKLCERNNYQSAGTVEYVVDSATGKYYFLEVNTRLQVEHAVTEMVTGIDIVDWMLRVACDDPDFSVDTYKHTPSGHSIECRVYAEDPSRGFRPCSGVVTSLKLSDDDVVRYDNWIQTGTKVTIHYDPLLMKVIVHGQSRPQAIDRMFAALGETKVGGIQTNLHFLRELCSSVPFKVGEISTNFCESFKWDCPCVEVIESGMYSTLQNWPGRKGYWSIGVPPSGPMDHLSMRVANRLVGNVETACGIEMTIGGMCLKFYTNCTVAVTGAEAPITYNGKVVSQYSALQVQRDGVLKIGTVKSAVRTYLAVSGGFDVPTYLGSQSTFVLGRFGGLQGSTLKVGDMIPLTASTYDTPFPHLPTLHIPIWTSTWEIGVMYGPHGAPDFFTEEYMDLFWSSTWKVHHNSNRLGVRLIGPKPKWSRKDGGEAGLHPSNIHDCEYVIGCLNFTGEHPVILGVDGPSLGGFVCPVTIVSAELWKMGQLAPGDKVKFVRISFEQALSLKKLQHDTIESVGMRRCKHYPALFSQTVEATQMEWKRDAVLSRSCVGQHEITVRAQGDEGILIEYGEMVLDLELRFLVGVFMEWIEAYKSLNPHCGIGEVSPGIRSVQVQFNTHLDKVLDTIRLCVYKTSDEDIPSREIHLPLAFDDRWNQEAIQRYMDTVSSKTPYVPSNIDFVARINGLKSRHEVKEVLLNATYLILGLGDVYLNAPCAVPIDPRHRLVTSKYSPTRSFTPEGAVGIGGSYLCIYGMESPGGYQLVGRTLPIWSLWKTPPFLFRFFDQIKFYLVSDDELLKRRKDYASGRSSIQMKNTFFKKSEYRRLVAENSTSIEEFRKRQRIAFEVERKRWEEMGMIGGHDVEDIEEIPTVPICSGNPINATISGNVWKIMTKEGDFVEENQIISILESMKMEFCIRAACSGVVKAIVKDVGQFVQAGECIMVLE